MTPLRGLAADTVRALQSMVESLGLPWTIAVRTGDASSRDKRLVRQAQAEVVVITPESLSLLQTYPETGERLAHLRAIIVEAGPRGRGGQGRGPRARDGGGGGRERYRGGFHRSIGLVTVG